VTDDNTKQGAFPRGEKSVRALSGYGGAVCAANPEPLTQRHYNIHKLLLPLFKRDTLFDARLIESFGLEEE
jgi:hypothetical protein